LISYKYINSLPLIVAGCLIIPLDISQSFYEKRWAITAMNRCK
jgi:hypothetical protein